MATPARVLFRSRLRLSGDLELNLMQHVMQQRTRIRSEQGWLDATPTSGLGVIAQNTAWRAVSATGWALKRQEAYSGYENDFSFRAVPSNAARYSSLYKMFNVSLNIPQRAINVFKGRVCEALFNSEPFLAFQPEGQDDPAPEIKLAERVTHYKFKASDTRSNFREAVRQACLSEAVLKTTVVPVVKPPRIDEDAQIWLDRQGQPVRDSFGGYVFSDDEIQNHPDILGAKVLVRDPQTMLDGTEFLSAPMPLLRDTETEFQIQIKPTGYNNFFCSPLASDIHTTDTIFHEFDELYTDMLSRVQGMTINKEAKRWLDSLENSAQRYPQSEGAQPIFSRGERDAEMFGPVRLHVCETWTKFDVMKRGRADELCVVWAIAGNGTEAWPIYYDTMERASPTGRRPFDVWRVIPVRDRWYGFGFYDLLSNDHDFVDESWNRLRARSSASGRMDWIKRDSFEGLEYGRPVSLSSGMVYVLKSDKTGPIGEHMGSLAFPEMDDKIWKMLEMAIQMGQLRSGTMTPGDAAFSSLPANKTATGQDLLANESELLSNDTMQDIIAGANRTIYQGVVAIFNTPDEESKAALKVEILELLGADDGQKLINWLAGQKPQKLAEHIKLSLTKARSKQAMQANMQMNQIITGGLSWVQIVEQMPQWAEQLEPMFLDMMQALDSSNPKSILKIPDAIKQLALQQQQAQAAQPTRMPSKSTLPASIPATAGG